MKVSELKKMLDVALNSNTIYMMGCFGMPVTDALIKQKQKQYSWYTQARVDKIKKCVGKNYFGFDCIGLIKGIGWGWNGDRTKEYGGAKYESNGIHDATELQMINSCKSVSTDMNKIQEGELLYMKGHCGIYAGKVNGIDYCYECTPAGTGNVQYRPMSKQKWEKHGKLPWVDYATVSPSLEHDPYYRIRKTWNDEKSQVGAYINFDYAKEACPSGYTVFDWNGKALYTNANCPYSEPTTTLYKGCEKGKGVSWLQWHLVRLGFLAPKLSNGKNSIDGSFGLATHEAVIKFQTKYPECGGSDGKPDGRIGKASRAKLKALV